MLRIRHNQRGFSDLEQEADYGGWSGIWNIRSRAFQGRTLSLVFQTRTFSKHFGTRKFDFFRFSYLFPMEDGLVTDTVIEIHENWLDCEREERRQALVDESDEAEFAARCGRRLNRKKNRGHRTRRIR